MLVDSIYIRPTTETGTEHSRRKETKRQEARKVQPRRENHELPQDEQNREQGGISRYA